MRRKYLVLSLAAWLVGIALMWTHASHAGSDTRLRGHQYQRPMAATHFDAATDSYTKATNLLGLADGKTGTVSFWARLDGGDATTMTLFVPTGGGNERLTVRRDSGNKWDVRGSNSTPTLILELRSTTSYTTSVTWRHVMSSWDMGNALSNMYVDGASNINVSTFTNDTIAYNPSSLGAAIGGRTNGTNLFNGCISGLWFDTTYVDLSVAANRLKFRTAEGKPAYLGVRGEKPTGSQPAFYSRSGSGLDQRGSGGQMAVVAGSPTVCSTTP